MTGTQPSAKRPRVSEAFSQDDFQCGVCLELPTSPILQCQNGHTLCQDCYRRCNTCPQCRCFMNQKNPIRALMLEQIAEKLTFPCPHEGCDCHVKFKDMPKHKRFCCFGPVHCLNCRMEFSGAEEWAAHHLEETGDQVLQLAENGEAKFSIYHDSKRPVSASKLLVWNHVYFLFDARPSPVCRSYQIVRLFVVDIGKSFRGSAIHYAMTVFVQDSGLSVSANLLSKSIRFGCSASLDDDASLVVPPCFFRVQNNNTLLVKLKIGAEPHSD